MTDCPKCADVRDVRDHLAAEHILRVQIEKERLEAVKEARRLAVENERLKNEVRELYARLSASRSGGAK